MMFFFQWLSLKTKKNTTGGGIFYIFVGFIRKQMIFLVSEQLFMIRIFVIACFQSNCKTTLIVGLMSQKMLIFIQKTTPQFVLVFQA